MTEATDERLEQHRQKVKAKAAKLSDQLIRLNTLTLKGTIPPDDLIPELIPGDAERILVSGPSKAGKSWLVFELVYSLGTGLPFLGIYPLTHTEWEPAGFDDDVPLFQRKVVEGLGRTYKTLYIQLENSEYSMEKRGRSIQENRGGQVVQPDRTELPRWEGVPENHIELLIGSAIDLMDPVHVDALSEVAAAYDVVVLDSTYRFLTGTLNDEEIAKRLIQNIEQLRLAAEVKVIAIHHTSSKGPGGFRYARESMGSTFFTSAYWDHELRLNRSDKKKVITVTPVSRDYDFDPIKVRMPEAAEWVKVRDEQGESLQELRELLRKHDTWPKMKADRVYVDGFTQRELADQLDVSQSAIRRWLGLLVTETPQVDASDLWDES